MPSPVSAIHTALQALTAGLLLSSPLVYAADSVVRIFGVGQGYTVPPGERFKVHYQVIPDAGGDHYFYIDEALVLVRNANLIDRTASGTFNLTYPAGLAKDRLLELRICIGATPVAPCDQVSIRAGHVLTPEQAIEISPSGVAGHLPPLTSVDIGYTILKPTASDQLFYIDDELRERRTATSPQSGFKTIRYSGGLKDGEERLLRFCVDEGTASSACGFAMVTGGQPPDGVDVPEPFSAADLAAHYQPVTGCSPVCGYYSNIYYGDPDVSWVPERGDGQPDGLRMDLYYSHPDGRLNPEAPPATLIIYGHSAGSNKESLLSRNQSLLSHLLDIADSGAGVVVASIDFRHPLKQLEDDLTPTSVDDFSHAIQFARHQAAALNINPDDIFLVGTSLGGGVAVHAAVRDIANPSDPSEVRRTSSSVRGVVTRDAQTSFSPHWFRSHFLETAVAARYQTDLLDDEQRLIYGHAPAGVNSDSPLMELLYTSHYIDHKVTLPEYLGRTVDLVHLPNYGLVMEAQYQLYGLDDRIRVMERYAGNFGRDAARFIAQHRLGRY
ncbi:alpha/beta hydrolase [Halopseudomonas salegens]|uniref:Alpha/beta hydrolase fold n=1 Tax=Halopseudomonas salegens TaxID=1434072 RepID=A0A1H2G327_9GAMM|nr:alpha/beta hydrolase fold domain-containing protein [Halopseudomonas salegens]SDU14036.1 alpha/beta hydrolase fold [Halopseudomonas salegens]